MCLGTRVWCMFIVVYKKACAHCMRAQYVHVVCAYVYLVCVMRRVHVWVGPKDPLGNATQHCVGADLHCREGEMV